MNHDNKRQERRLKRIIKKASNKKLRSQLKKDLRDNPNETHIPQIDESLRKYL